MKILLFGLLSLLLSACGLDSNHSNNASYSEQTSHSEQISPQDTAVDNNDNQTTSTESSTSENSTAVLEKLPFAACDLIGDWQLNPALSSLSYISSKKTNVLESNYFNTFNGSINREGIAQLNIDLNSIDTGVELRDSRVREHLFNTSEFFSAQIDLQLDRSQFQALPLNQPKTENIHFTLSLHGYEKDLSTQLTGQCLSQDRLLITSSQPILVSANDFGMTQGLETLRELAALDVISPVVSVDLALMFDRRPEQGE